MRAASRILPRLGRARLTALALALAWLGIGTARSEDCPILESVGQIERIEGSNDLVHLIRGGHEIPVAVGTCILQGDILDATLSPGVWLSTVDGGPPVLGQGHPRTVWKPPRFDELDPGLGERLQAAFRTLFAPGRPAPRPAEGRGEAFCADPPSKVDGGKRPPTKPLAGLEMHRQRVEASLSTLHVAWKPRGDTMTIHVRLSDAENSLISESMTCKGNSVDLRVPAGRLKAGSGARLEIEAGGRADIVYLLEVVPNRDPAELPTADSLWALAALQFVDPHADSERLNALSLLGQSAKRYYGAWRIMTAIELEEPLR